MNHWSWVKSYQQQLCRSDETPRDIPNQELETHRGKTLASVHKDLQGGITTTHNSLHYHRTKRSQITHHVHWLIRHAHNPIHYDSQKYESLLRLSNVSAGWADEHHKPALPIYIMTSKTHKAQGVHCVQHRHNTHLHSQQHSLENTPYVSAQRHSHHHGVHSGAETLVVIMYGRQPIYIITQHKQLTENSSMHENHHVKDKKIKSILWIERDTANWAGATIYHISIYIYRSYDR